MQGQLKDRLKRVEMYGDLGVHPGEVLFQLFLHLNLMKSSRLLVALSEEVTEVKI